MEGFQRPQEPGTAAQQVLGEDHLLHLLLLQQATSLEVPQSLHRPSQQQIAWYVVFFY